MFLFSYRGVAFVLLLIALCSYLLISGHYGMAQPWINAVMLVLIALLFIRTWLG
jgi:hypothetical protein